MPRIHLRVYLDPGMAEVFIRFKQKDGNFVSVAAIIDTGAEICLFPLSLLDTLEHRLSQRAQIKAEQAGIAHQAFDATEAYI